MGGQITNQRLLKKYTHGLHVRKLSENSHCIGHPLEIITGLFNGPLAKFPIDNFGVAKRRNIEPAVSVSRRGSFAIREDKVINWEICFRALDNRKFAFRSRRQVIFK